MKTTISFLTQDETPRPFAATPPSTIAGAFPHRLPPRLRAAGL